MIEAASEYDLVAIGAGPAGQRAAIQATQLGKRAAIVECREFLGGGSTNTGTLPSKTLRAAILEVAAYRSKQEITLDDLMWRAQQVIEHEREVIQDQLRRSGVEVIPGYASFVDPHTLDVLGPDGVRRLSAERFVIAVGTTPARPPGVDFDDRTVLDSDGILHLSRLPRTLTVVGGGVIGLEYASMAAALGVDVTLVEKRSRVLDFVDGELVEALQYHLRGLGLDLRLREEGTAVERRAAGGVVTHLSSGGQLTSDVVLYTAGRRGATNGLNLAAAGLAADEHGQISVGSDFRTARPHIYAAGDVVGYPTHAAAALDQGRQAALAAFSGPVRSVPACIPYAIYSIPELSFVGSGERELTEASVPYVVGISRHRDLTRSAIAGDRAGLLKLLVHTETRQVLGVHIFGTSAAELVHVGQTAMAGGLTADYLADAVFNVPAFTDAYRAAALDAVGRLDEIVAGRAHAA